MKRQNIRHSMDGMLTLLLFGVFAVCVLAVLLTGAQAYRRIVERDQTAHSRRACIQYIATNVRQNDRIDGVWIEDFQGIDALSFNTVPGYITRIYCYQGSLMELYAPEGVEMLPENGEKILDLKALHLDLKQGILTVTAEGEGGDVSRLSISLRSAAGGGGSHEE